ncbi:hypothetical protein GCM10027269_63600 [Kribbella endophytica]
MEFHGNDLGACSDQWSGQRTESGPYVEDEVTGTNPGSVDDALGPTTIERMPSPGTPRLPGGGHDGPSRST